MPLPIRAWVASPIQAISNRDLPIAQGTVLVSALIYLGVNLLTDITYVMIDPRVRY